MSPAISHHWQPIALPADPTALQVEELRAFEVMWRRERESLHEQRAVLEFNERMARWWSIETGIIERLQRSLRARVRSTTSARSC